MHAGDEAEVVCLHGLGRDPSDWDAVRGVLERYGRVSAPALARHPDRAFAAAERAVRPGAIVVGHSMGGVIALRIASETSRPLRGIVLAGCAFPVARNGRSRRATAADYAAHRIAFLRSIRSRPRGAGPRAGTFAGLTAVARVLGRPGRFDAMFGSITAPVLIVHARDDHHVPVDFALAAAARHRGWDIRVLERGGHHAHLRAPTEWLAAAEPWLAGLGAGG